MSAALADALLAWFERERRDLPWRRTRDPYAIWLSEVMLQQTRVATVVPYWERFLAELPSVGALAEAPLERVLSLWSGLGYYSRARALHRAATLVVREHAGELPRSYEGLRALPGVGDYTAGAVASIAFGAAVPAVDGNVVRVVARLFAVALDPKSQRDRARAGELVAARLPLARAGDVNQALMELGATACAPRAPRCGACAVAPFCEARASGREGELPVVRRKAPPPVVERRAFVLTRGDAVLLARRPPSEALFGGLWEPPTVDADARAPALALRALAGLRVKLEPAGRLAHVLTHRRLEVEVFRGRTRAAAPPCDGYEESRWVPRADVGALGTSTLARRLISLAG